MKLVICAVRRDLTLTVNDSWLGLLMHLDKRSVKVTINTQRNRDFQIHKSDSG